MKIKHRIFTKAYKRNLQFANKKTSKKIYKKFLGLETLSMYKSVKQSVKRKNIKKIFYKPRPGKIINHKLHFLLSLKRLKSDQRRKEAALARKDVKNFITVCAPQNTSNEDEAIKNFVSFIPKPQWAKMTGKQRHDHLLKRNELQSKGLLKNKGKFNKSSLIQFSNATSRPLLKLLTKLQRRNYLKSLVLSARKLCKLGTTENVKQTKLPSKKPEKLSKLLNSKAPYKNLKTLLIKGKNLRKGNRIMLKNTTISSILAMQNIIKLKNVQA